LRDGSFKSEVRTERPNRRCTVCQSYLSMYNKADQCFAHQDGVAPGALSIPTSKPQGVSQFYGELG